MFNFFGLRAEGNFKCSVMNMQQVITDKLIKDVSNRFDEIIIEGLKLKGFEFANRMDLENFIRQRCKCVDDFIDEIKFYYVDEKPFLEHHYKQEPFEFKNDKGTITLSASWGSYRFV